MAASKYKLISGASINLTEVRNGPCNIAGGYIINTNAAIRYVKFFDVPDTLTSALISGGNFAPILTVLCTASVATPLGTLGPDAINFRNNLYMVTTVSIGDTAVDAVGAGDLYIHLFLEN